MQKCDLVWPVFSQAAVGEGVRVGLWERVKWWVAPGPGLKSGLVPTLFVHISDHPAPPPTVHEGQGLGSW